MVMIPKSFEHKYVPKRCAECGSRNVGEFYYEPHLASHLRIDASNKPILRFCNILCLRGYLIKKGVI